MAFFIKSNWIVMAINEKQKRYYNWLNQVKEEIIDPQLPIIDPHHHMWRSSGLPVYLLEDLWSDTQSGHNIVKTVFYYIKTNKYKL